LFFISNLSFLISDVITTNYTFSSRPRKSPFSACLASSMGRSKLNLFTMLWRVSNRKSHQFRWGLLKIFSIEKQKKQHVLYSSFSSLGEGSVRCHRLTINVTRFNTHVHKHG
jgi:hypothetical protein